MSVAIVGPPAGDSGDPQDGATRAAARLDLEQLLQCTEAALRAVGRVGDELTVSLVGDREIAALNARYRNKPRATDVLSFSLLEGEHSEYRSGLLGDIVISVETAARQARERHRGLDEVVGRLVIHGLLHVIGHDHEAHDEARVMRAEERRLWKLVGP